MGRGGEGEKGRKGDCKKGSVQKSVSFLFVIVFSVI